MRGLIATILFLSFSFSCLTAVNARTTSFDEYWDLDRINEYLFELQAEYPELIEVEEMGVTSENRTLYGVRIVNTTMLEQQNYTMPIILITAGASARDWISTMAAIDIIHELVEHYDEFRIIVDYLEWFIIPVFNPDGYAFSWTDGNRDWVKNRRANAGSDCIGVNLERNFDINWESEINSSDDPCSDVFRGPTHTSEEPVRLIKFFMSFTHRLQEAYISLQAGIQNTFNGHIGYPYAFSNEAIPDDWERKQGVANDMSARIHRITGARYRTGGISNLAGPSAGTSVDYAAREFSAPLAYTIYAPPSGRFGWDVEEWRINPIVDQIFSAVDDMARHIIFSPTNDAEN